MTFYHCEFTKKTDSVTTLCTEKQILCRRHNQDDIWAVAESLGVAPENVFVTKQTHSLNVTAVDIKTGEGTEYLLSEMNGNVTPCDGLVTDNPGVLLCSYEADCVPVFLFDPVKKVAAMVHSGWRGTAGKISRNAVMLMKEKYGCNPENILAAFGPHICRECYEVGPEVKAEFMENFTEDNTEKLFAHGKGDRLYLDLSLAIRITLEEAGVKTENISGEEICTYHGDRFCSYRRDGEKEHRMLTGIIIN